MAASVFGARSWIYMEAKKLGLPTQGEGAKCDLHDIQIDGYDMVFVYWLNGLFWLVGVQNIAGEGDMKITVLASPPNKEQQV